jgi:hypothetical protein
MSADAVDNENEEFDEEAVDLVKTLGMEEVTPSEPVDDALVKRAMANWATIDDDAIKRVKDLCGRVFGLDGCVRGAAIQDALLFRPEETGRRTYAVRVTAAGELSWLYWESSILWGSTLPPTLLQIWASDVVNELMCRSPSESESPRLGIADYGRLPWDSESDDEEEGDESSFQIILTVKTRPSYFRRQLQELNLQTQRRRINGELSHLLHCLDSSSLRVDDVDERIITGSSGNTGRSENKNSSAPNSCAYTKHIPAKMNRFRIAARLLGENASSSSCTSHPSRSSRETLSRNSSFTLSLSACMSE